MILNKREHNMKRKITFKYCGIGTEYAKTFNLFPHIAIWWGRSISITFGWLVFMWRIGVNKNE